MILSRMMESIRFLAASIANFAMSTPDISGSTSSNANVVVDEFISFCLQTVVALVNFTTIAEHNQSTNESICHS